MPLTMPYARPLTTASGRSEFPVSLTTATGPAAAPSPLPPPSSTRAFVAPGGEAPSLSASSGFAVCCFDAVDAAVAADAAILCGTGDACADKCAFSRKSVVGEGKERVGKSGSQCTFCPWRLLTCRPTTRLAFQGSRHGSVPCLSFLTGSSSSRLARKEASLEKHSCFIWCALIFAAIVFNTVDRCNW